MNDNRSPDETSKTSTAVQTQDQGHSSLTRLLLVGLVIGAGVIMIKQLPDLRRYIKMKSM